MRRRFSPVLFGILVLLIVLDWYVFYSLNDLFSVSNDIYTVGFWLPTLLFFVFFIFVMIKKPWQSRKPDIYKQSYYLMGFLVLLYFPKIAAILFFLLNDITNWVIHFFDAGFQMNGLNLVGLLVGIIAILLALYGIVFGKYHFKTERLNLPFERLPKTWEGLKIIHLSDIHIGSWAGKQKKMQKVVNRINSENPDLILFTGDLVNNVVNELEGFEDIMKEMRASIGKYSILGNHDYGDYFQWNSPDEKRKNLEELKEVQKRIGFHLLMNDSVVLHNNDSTLGLIGVENWGLPPFHQNGDLEKAMKTLREEPDFSILMTHDPSHWKQKVWDWENIDLTLSGHTHGMQFGIYTKKLKWSPAQWKYPQWGGLYRHKHQKLFVSTGLGFIGFPGRIGIRPKITLIKLERK
jgi:hypothetical protein